MDGPLGLMAKLHVGWKNSGIPSLPSSNAAVGSNHSIPAASVSLVLHSLEDIVKLDVNVMRGCQTVKFNFCNNLLITRSYSTCNHYTVCEFEIEENIGLYSL